MSEEWPETDRVESIEGFAKWLSKSIASGNDMGSIYRGQRDSRWHLQPSLDRILPKNHSDPERLAEEKRIEQVFRCQALRFLGCLERQYAAASRSDCMMVMQHFGVPTRLLDWTQSPAVAAYFACIDGWDSDGAIWKINSKAVVDFVDPRWQAWGFDRCSDEPGSEIKLEPRIFEPNVAKFVTLIRHKIPFPRAQAQRGLFTMGSRLGIDHEAVLKDQVHEGDCKRIVIRADLKRQILGCLEQMGIDAVSLQHAGADSVGLRMTWDLKQQRRNAPADIGGKAPPIQKCKA